MKLLELSLKELKKQGVPFVKLADLKPWEDNPNHHAEEVPEIVASLKRFGWTAPIIVRMADNEISDGHGRATAAKLLGIEAVPVIRREFSEYDSHLYAIANKKVAEASWFEPEALQNVIDGLGGEMPLDELKNMGLELEELDLGDGGFDDPGGGKGGKDKPTHVCPKCGFEWEQ